MSMSKRLRISAAGVGRYLGRLACSPTFWQGVGVVAGFWALAAIVDFLPLYAMTRVILLVVSVGVLLAYLPGFLEAMVARPIRDGEQLVLGIWVAWAGDIMLGVWAITQRWLDRPEWMLTSDFVTFIVFVKLLGATLHLTSPGSVEGRVPRGNWVLLAIAFSLGALVAGVLLATSMGVGLFGT